MNKIDNSKISVWIFATIIDNFGDAGVAYRLARGLAHNKGWQITLWCDNWEKMQKLEPGLKDNPVTEEGVICRFWSYDSSPLEKISFQFPAPHVVFEIFGSFSHHLLLGSLPKPYLHIDLEYLSAEKWTLDFHLKPSFKADTDKYFYFLGFQEGSGGLLIENDYAAKKQFFIQNKEEKNRFLHQYGIKDSDKKKFLLFSYKNSQLNRWLALWKDLSSDIELWLTGDQNKAAIDAQLLNHFNYQELPFVAQRDFDKLLWLSDFALVRGEDSFVRAQLASIPFFWNIYPQADKLHLHKLAAFSDLLKPFYPLSLFTAYQALSEEFNGGKSLNHAERKKAWALLLKEQQKWQQASQKWSKTLLQPPSAFEKLTQFIEKKIQSA